MSASFTPPPEVGGAPRSQHQYFTAPISRYYIYIFNRCVLYWY